MGKVYSSDQVRTLLRGNVREEDYPRALWDIRREYKAAMEKARQRGGCTKCESYRIYNRYANRVYMYQAQEEVKAVVAKQRGAAGL